jgi:flagellar biosynthesis protein FlhG
MPNDQAAGLRRLMQAQEASPARTARVVAVTSGKGGVGKTNLAVNVAIALAARGRRILLLDMDLGLANADVMLGVDARVNWWHVIRGQRDVREAITPAPGGIDLLAGGSGLAGLADLSEFERHRLLRDIETLCDRYDVLLLDCGAGVARTVVSFSGAADLVVVVATPEPTAMTDAYAMIKVLHRDTSDRTLGLVVNQARDRHEAAEVYERIAGVAARFLRMPVIDLGYVVHDPRVAAAIRRRSPVILSQAGSAAAACLVTVAGRLERQQELPESQAGFLRRVANWFL